LSQLARRIWAATAPQLEVIVPLDQDKLIGFVEVDSGTLLIGDPAYVLPDVARDKAGIDYEAVLNASEPIGQLDGQPVLLLQAFGGDGTFPVFGHFEDGELIRVTVDLVELQGGTS
jgi:hypothetical protein